MYRKRYLFSAFVTGASAVMWVYLALTADGPAESLLLTYSGHFSLICALASFYCLAVAFDRKLKAVHPGSHEYKQMSKLLTFSNEAQALKKQIESDERRIYGFDLHHMQEIAKVESPSKIQ